MTSVPLFLLLILAFVFANEFDIEPLRNRSQDDITGGADNAFPIYRDLKGKVAVVTGGSSGIGEATVWAFVQQRSKVVFCGRDANRGHEVETRMRLAAKELGDTNSVYFFKADVSKDEDCRKLMDFVYEKFGTFDVALNNAGVPGPIGPIHTHPIGEIDTNPASPEGETWIEDPLKNNIYGVYQMLKYQARAWVKEGKSGGSIINTSSMNGLDACPSCCLYAASKHAIIGLTKSVALEYVDETAPVNFRVNAIAPGMVDTRFTRNQVKLFNPTKYPEEFLDAPPEIFREDDDWKVHEAEFAAANPSHTLGQPWEMANAVVFLASRASSFITGVTLPVSMGSSAS
eukprot:TRINITY_DN4761_c0_g1_i2.p1 TRINITY_DN4761_c0_g1~~TRINITY_DN4761_c0_g1_i2.p1  ORF type:complete len:344 (+),score=109.23 TRINITY_DN4761_c0_g1_i2:80-1111(+)